MTILARKGSICLVYYDGNFYGVERQTKATAYGLFYNEDLRPVAEFFAKAIAKERKTANDFFVSLYAHT